MAWSKAKTAIAIGTGVLLVGGATSVAVKEVVAHRGNDWQRNYDTTIVDRVRPQTKILPALRSRDPRIDSWGDRNGKMLGLGVSSTDIVQAANGASLGRMIFSIPMPEGKYDFISNVRDNPQAALQQAVKDSFGLASRRVLIETNVLALTLRHRDAPGLQLDSHPPANRNNSRSPDSITCVYAPISKLVEFLENALGTPIVDRTGLTGRFDIRITWDSTPEGLKRALLPQLGLELVPDRLPVEFLVVEKAN